MKDTVLIEVSGADGITGTQAHDNPRLTLFAETAKTGKRVPVIFPLSAPTQGALAALAERAGARLREAPDALGDIVRERPQGPTARLCAVAPTGQDIARLLSGFARGERDPNLRVSNLGVSNPRAMGDPAAPPTIGWVFAGQGPLWSGMGGRLYATEPAFRRKLDEIETLMRAERGLSILGELNASGAAARLDRTEIAQPVFFAIQVSLAALLQSWGLRPAMIVGHCVGEIAAAHIAGMLTLGDAVRLVHDRARIAERARGLGGMAAVEIDLDEAAALLSEIGDGLGIAAINGPSALTLSGPAGTLGEVCARLTAQGRFARVLDIDYPFHGRLMEPMVAEMAAVGEDMPVAMPTTPIFSAVLGRQATRGDFAPDYWSRNLRETIRFAPAITAMAAAGCDLFVEIGSHPILSYAIRQVLEANGAGGEILATMHRESDEAQESDEAADLRGCAAAHFVRGVTLDWSTLAAPDPEWKPQSGPVIDQAIPPDAPPPRSEAAPGLREALAAAAPGPARRQIMERRIRERLAEIIGTSSTRFDTRLPFNALGLDSLTALRLRDALERDTGLKLPAAVIFNHATIASLATELAARLGTPLEVAVTKPAPAEIADDDELSALLAALREMPEEEALRLLEADAVAR